MLLLLFSWLMQFLVVNFVDKDSLASALCFDTVFHSVVDTVFLKKVLTQLLVFNKVVDKVVDKCVDIYILKKVLAQLLKDTSSTSASGN